MRRLALLVLVAAVLRPATLRAQPAGCTYAECGLWLSRGQLLQGDSGRLVREDSVGGHLLLRAGGDVRRRYESSRRWGRTSNALAGAALAALVVTVVKYPKKGEPWSREGRVWAPLAFAGSMAIGIPVSQREYEHLSVAVWRYNRRLAGGGTRAGGETSGCTYDRCALRVRHGLYSSRIVQGAGDAPVPRDGARRLALPATYLDQESTRDEYEALRTANGPPTASSWILLGSLVGAAALTLASRDDEAQAAAGVLGGVGYATGCMTIRGKVKLELQRERAVWLYNGALPASP